MMDIPREAIYQLVSKIDVMKPNTVKPEQIKQMAKLDMLLDSPDYVVEEKIDGCHYLMVSCLFFSTDHVEKTDNYPHLRDFFIQLGMPNLIIDGEIHYPGKTSQYATHVTGADPTAAVTFQRENGWIHYYFWDMLRTPKGTWIINQPYSERRKLLQYFYDNYIRDTPMAEFIHIANMTKDNKRQFKEAVIAKGGEGIVLKKINSLYVMGKKPAWMWMKMKVIDYADLFISGYEAPNVDYSGTDFDNHPYWKEINGVLKPVSKNYFNNWIGALELSAYVNGQVMKICTCSGISEELRKNISENKEKYLDKVVKISFMEMTEAGYPRHPRFEQFHESKTAKECEWSFDV
jgi:ATP-dependent DNA ligase